MNNLRDELKHYGVLGMKWGVRRYQNKDGTLTPAGKKKVSKQYKKLSEGVKSDLSKRYNQMYVDSSNKAADRMNSGVIDKFNEDQRKKYGKNFADRDGYMADYETIFEKEVAKNLNQKLSTFYQNNESYKKGQALVKKHNMTSWDDLAKRNEQEIKQLREIVKNIDKPKKSKG